MEAATAFGVGWDGAFTKVKVVHDTVKGTLLLSLKSFMLTAAPESTVTF